jgi:transcriptional regulator with XRE-family HTH domain
MNAGQLLREARIERGLDQAALARRAGTTQAYVSRVERGVVSPSLETLARLLHAMGLRMRLSTEPLPHGNAHISDLRADLRGLTPEERLEQAMELSAFVVDLAESAAEQEQGRSGPRQR